MVGGALGSSLIRSVKPELSSGSSGLKINLYSFIFKDWRPAVLHSCVCVRVCVCTCAHLGEHPLGVCSCRYLTAVHFQLLLLVEVLFRLLWRALESDSLLWIHLFFTWFVWKCIWRFSWGCRFTAHGPNLCSTISLSLSLLIGWGYMEKMFNVQSQSLLQNLNKITI